MSETIATMALIAASVVLGSVAYVWASSASVSAENSLGKAAQGDIRAVSEKFEIVATNFSNTNQYIIDIWLLNSGIYDTSVSSVILNYTTSNPITCDLTSSNPTWAIPKGHLESYQLSIQDPNCAPTPPTGFSPGNLQTIKAIGEYGFYATYQVQS